MTAINPLYGLDASVIISTHNRAEILKLTLDGLARQETNGHTWEVIVVDNGCTDDTKKLLKNQPSDLPLVALEEPQLGKNRAINRALNVARGELLIFTDDDALVESNWVEAYLDATKRWPENSVFCGPVIPKFPSATPAWMQAESFPFAAMAFTKLDFSDIEEESPLAFGPNLAIRRKALSNLSYNENIGPQGKNYAMGSETELLRRLKTQGERFIYIPATRVQHVIRPEQTKTSWLLGRAYRSGRGHVRLKETFQGRRIFGVPPYIWKRWIGTNCRRLLSLMSGPQSRCVSGMNFQAIRGQMAEYRNQIVDQNSETDSSVE